MSERINYEYRGFGPFLFKTTLPSDFISELLIHAKKTKESHNAQLAGHIQSQFKFPDEVQNWFYNNILPYVSAYRKGHCEYHYLKNLPIELKGLNLWVNFMKSGEYNPLHTHSGDYSFVIYLDVPPEIEKEAEKFEGTDMKPGGIKFVYTQEAKPQWATTDQRFVPKTGEMFIFPALLQHYVAPFKSNVTRISVSGNIMISNRSELPPGYF